VKNLLLCLFILLISINSYSDSFRNLQTDFMDGGSSSDRNYIKTSNFEANIKGWTRFKDTGSRVVDGTGGSPDAGFTVERSTTTPLRGSGSMLLTVGGTLQANGVAYDFTIDKADQTKQMTIKFDYEVASGTYSGGTSTTDSDLIFYIVGDTGGTPTPIEPTPFKLDCGLNVQCTATAQFQTLAAVTGYRLVFYVATSANAAFTMKVDDIRIGPTRYAFGSSIGDWQTYTPTGAWTSNTTYTGGWRRVGSDIEVFVAVSLSGAPTSATFTAILPSGLTVDTTKISSSTTLQHTCGIGRLNDANGSSYPVTVLYNSTNSVKLAMTDDAATGTVIAGYVDQATPITFAASDSIYFSFKLPISGWTTNSLMSESSPQTPIFAYYKEASGQTIGSGASAIIDIADKSADFANNVTTGAAWKFTAQSPGRYAFNIGVIGQTASGGWDEGDVVILGLYKNGARDRILDYKEADGSPASQTAQALKGNGSIQLNTGDYIDFRVDNAVGENWVTVASADYVWVNILKVPNSESILATSKVIAEYALNASTANTSVASSGTEIVDFNLKVRDNFSAVTTGAAWKFTAPRSDFYLVNAAMIWSSTANQTQSQLYIYVNGAGAKCISLPNGVVQGLSGSKSVWLDQGQYLDVRAYQVDSGAAARNIEQDASLAWITISSQSGI
jgi:hypothetical protein